eukprot:CAMPEP_0197681880 /NCGR_PEP_ID=MMETSP1338-20131121/95617_1 /TAXON_ID=43686 ORGANISM="Pelagodinium beii, Strain RCC1491" /NCGR_SAMPLE_ID=MMETSP1338 /ASSEMBLY_ACC=CAM_ASM_000754 /LENGTH=289 /DNA_ID=CAMNT_0043263279 /DNA_START=153 /DNA_END=1022 /DNA_ORIENTATION=-
MSGSEDRLQACQHVIGTECPTLLGEVWKSYGAWGSVLCGSADFGWNDRLGLMTTSFELAHKYGPAQEGGSNQGIDTPVFQSFVVIILMIWWMSVFTEWRDLIDWWVILLFIPIEKPGVSAYHRAHDDHLEVTAMPINVKAFTILLNLLPRTLVGVTVAFVGTDFLITSDSYLDLILNSVALAFLIEIDEMLFAALMSQHEKEDIEICGSIEVKHQCFGFFDTLVFNFPTPLLRAAMLISLCVGFIVNAYSKKDGKYDMGYALACLCHAEGDFCMTAQYLGGHATLASSK